MNTVHRDTVNRGRERRVTATVCMYVYSDKKNKYGRYLPAA